MHPRAIFAIARKDALDVALNKSTLTVLLTPIFLAVLFTVLSGLLGGHSTQLLVYNPGGSGVEQVLTAAFPDARVTHAGTAAEVSAAFAADGASKKTQYALGVALPADFEAAVRQGARPTVSLYVNGDNVSNAQRQLLVQALTEYTRAVAQPQPPLALALTTINPPRQTSTSTELNTFYAVAALLSSLLAGTSLVPGLLIEEKERKTLRMLMVSPASFADIVAAKVLVGLSYQLVLSLVVMAVMRAFTGQTPLVLLYLLLGGLFAVTLGLVFGAFFRTTSAAGAASGIVSFVYIVPVFFVGSFGQVFGTNLVGQVMHALPTYYLADGILTALQGHSTSSVFLNVAVLLGSTLALFLLSAELLRRQAAVASIV